MPISCQSSSMVEYQLPKLATGVRFPSLAFWLLAAISIVCSFNLIGCATAPTPPPAAEIPKVTGGIYHQVRQGDTLWRISQAYGVDLAALARANNLSGTEKITAGQRIFVPGAALSQTIDISKLKLYENDLFIWPVKGDVISFFNQDVNGVRNKGINIKTNNEVQVVAARGGKVLFASDYFKGLGKVIIIDHLDGFLTVYAQNSQILVKAGDNVGQSQVIARAGLNNGRPAGSCLHFEIRKNHKPQNPIFYLP